VRYCEENSIADIIEENEMGFERGNSNASKLAKVSASLMKF
jgi:hypothetical protein